MFGSTSAAESTFSSHLFVAHFLIFHNALTATRALPVLTNPTGGSASGICYQLYRNKDYRAYVNATALSILALCP